MIAEAERMAAASADRMWVEIPRLHLAMSVGDWATGRRVADALADDLPSLPLLARTSTAISLVNVHSNNGDPHVALDVAAVFEDSPLLTSMAAGPIARALTRVGRWDDGLAVAADAVAQDGDRGLLYLAWLTIAVRRRRARRTAARRRGRAGRPRRHRAVRHDRAAVPGLPRRRRGPPRARPRAPGRGVGPGSAFRPLQRAAVDARPEGRARLARR